MRTFKNLLREQMRALESTGEQWFLMLAVRQFNLLLGLDASIVSCAAYWDNSLVPGMKARFASDYLQLFPSGWELFSFVRCRLLGEPRHTLAAHNNRRHRLVALTFDIDVRPVPQASKSVYFRLAQIATGVSFSINCNSRIAARQPQPLVIDDIYDVRAKLKCMKTWLPPSALSVDNERGHSDVCELAIVRECDLSNRTRLLEGLTGNISHAKWRRTTNVVLTEYYRPEDYDTFRSAALELCSLDHPNILRVYGVCQELRSSVTEFASGGTLLDLLAECDGLVIVPRSRARLPYTWRLLISIARGIAEGIKYLHSQCPPLLHRNLTAANVLVRVREIDGDGVRIINQLSASVNNNNNNSSLPMVRPS